MKVIVIGSTGTVGAPVTRLLAARGYEVVGASRNGEVKDNLDDASSIRALFDRVRDADYALGLRSKLMGQVSLARIAMDHLREGGSITLTTGVLAVQPMPGSASVSLVNAGLEGFVRAAALEMPRGVRINALSPPWVKETRAKLGMDPSSGLAAADVAKAYAASVEGSQQGAVLDPRQLD